MSGSKFVITVLVVATCLTCIVAYVGYVLLPSTAVKAEATRAEEQFTQQAIIPTTVPISSSVISITMAEFTGHVAEIHRHDEVMNQAGLDAVVDVAQSGDIAQGVIAVSGDLASSVQGIALLAVAAAMVAFVLFLARKGAQS